MKKQGNIKKEKLNLPEDIEKKCNTIIHTYSAGIGFIGAFPIPASDTISITPLQISMIVMIGKVFNQKVSKSAAKAILLPLASAVTGRTISKILVGWIPVIGSIINATTAVSLTEAIGWAAVKGFYQNDPVFSKEIKENPYSQEDGITLSKEEKQKILGTANLFLNGKLNKKDNSKEFRDLLFALGENISDPEIEEYFKKISALTEK